MRFEDGGQGKGKERTGGSMSGKTKIEWADRVWNPTVGCTPVSAGCANCYAKRMYDRFFQGKPFSEVQLHPERLSDPEKWKAPARVFVDSMSDLFHESVPDVFIEQVWEVMLLSTRHTFMVLTKRPDRMKKWVDQMLTGCMSRVFSNIWLGVSVEDQKTADERIPLLLNTPAAKRFVSVEPMLGAVDIGKYLVPGAAGSPAEIIKYHDYLDWVICGGESGPGARPMRADWARGLRDQCQEAGVPFSFKQWGEWETIGSGEREQLMWLGKQRTGRHLDGKEWNEFPEEK